MASAYLYRTQVAGTSTQKFTFSTWVRRSGAMSDYEGMLNCYTADANRNGIYFGSDTKLNVYFRTSSSSQIYYETTRRFRDTHGWYHIVVAVDTTQSTAGDRVKIYINGILETDFGSSTNPGQNTNFSCIGTNGLDLEVGRMQYGSTNTKYLNGSMTHVHFTDGYTYAASDFGETDSTTGIWKAKVSPSVTYGNNGFFLKMDNSANMGLDSSGQSHNQTTSGTIIQNKDTPSNVFAKLNSLNVPASNAPTFSLVDTKTVTMNVDPGYFGGTTNLGASSGKYYAEIKITDNNGVGNVGITFDPSEKARQGTTFSAQISNSFLYANTGKQYSTATGTSGASYGNTYDDGDIIGIAMDLDNSKLYFHKNGVYQNSGVPTSGSTGTGAISIDAGETYFFYLTDVGGNTVTYECNFGNGYFGATAVTSAQSPDDTVGIFEYDVPAGYRALCTKSLNAEEYS